MRRLRHIALNISTGISLTLLIGTVWMWIRAQHAADMLALGWSAGADERLTGRRVGLQGRSGSLELLETRYEFPPYDEYNAKKFRDDVRMGWAPSHQVAPPAAYEPVEVDSLSTQSGIKCWGFAWQTTRYKAQPGGLIPIMWINDDMHYYLNWRLTQVALPWWFLVLTFALAPARSIWRWRHAREVKPGYCSKCGYDLRATPDRCPECGSIPAKGAS